MAAEEHPQKAAALCVLFVHEFVPSFRSKYIIQKEMQQGTDFGQIAEVVPIVFSDR